ncbi:sushi, von Willebrand factor type A, EGF and pentraxin domain-containing protein 1-like [Mya arenaria]|uniref:sushi, von Willebrand factor type A, EGF and pentraxin domain-containing protein 1-like n=1 Tax=Mya arenaria TaxID=6604 RepID=UPI0022E5D7A5|nr:sushi, von Willebrand factor type A, EGF and pentraxin domain-containing protein 1-like [Mya arenaria]
MACIDPPGIVGGFVTTVGPYLDGSTAVYRCYTGYLMSGVSYITCTSSAWSATLPTCFPQDWNDVDVNNDGVMKGEPGVGCVHPEADVADVDAVAEKIDTVRDGCVRRFPDVTSTTKAVGGFTWTTWAAGAITNTKTELCTVSTASSPLLGAL